MYNQADSSLAKDNCGLSTSPLAAHPCVRAYTSLSLIVLYAAAHISMVYTIYYKQRVIFVKVGLERET